MKYNEWPEERKERARAAHRRWKDRNKDKRAKYYREYEARRPIAEKLFRSMKSRKILFDITPNDISVENECPICGIEMRISSRRGGSAVSPTLDKIIPNRGYVKGNIAVICKSCNSLKGKGSAEEHHRIANWIESRI